MNFWESQREQIGVKSQRQMARILGVSNQAVSSWEADKQSPTLTIKFLAEKYQASEHRIEKALIEQRRLIEQREERLAHADAD